MILCYVANYLTPIIGRVVSMFKYIVSHTSYLINVIIMFTPVSLLCVTSQIVFIIGDKVKPIKVLNIKLNMRGSVSSFKNLVIWGEWV